MSAERRSLRPLSIIEGAGHAVLAADGRKSEAELCVVSTEQCCERLAPSCRILRHSAEVLLEGEADLAEIAACCHDLRHGCPALRKSAPWYGLQLDRYGSKP